MKTYLTYLKTDLLRAALVVSIFAYLIYMLAYIYFWLAS